MPRLIWACLLVFASSGQTIAALDPEADKPYQLQVVVLFAEHRVFTPVFREQVERELRDNLQTALGNLGRVSMVRDHPLRDEIQSKGLLKVLDSVRLVSDTKTHFVLLDFVNGQYEIQARQHDGLTGMASTDERRMRIADRQLIGRSASLLVERDLGVIGTLPANVGDPKQGQQLSLTLKGGRLGVPLERWVQKDEVFAIAQISQGAGGLRSARVPDAFLRVVEAPRDGVCVCQLYYRYSPALPTGPGVLGFRCLKLATIESQLRLRVVRNDKGREPLLGLSVALSRDPTAPGKDDMHISNLNEPIQSKNKYRHLAFATVYKGSVRLAGPFPVPVLGDAPVTCPVGVTEEADRRGPLESRVRSLARGVSDSVLIYGNLAADFNKTSEKTPEAALKSGRTSLGLIRADLLHQGNELGALKADARKLSVNLERELTEIDQQLQELRGWTSKFAERLDELDGVLTQEKDPRLKEWRGMLQRARSLESELEFDQALALYDKVFAQAPNIAPELRDRVAKLKQQWTPRDAAHQAARDFIYLTWPRLTEGARIREQLREARHAFKVCLDAGDLLTPQKLLRASKEMVARLRKEADGLRPDASDDDRRAAEVLEEVAKELAQLILDVSKVVEKTPP